MPAGRPPIFDSPEQMQEAIDAYFDEEEVPTVSGLAYALGMDRRALLNYGNREEFVPTVKRAKERIEEHVEKMLFVGKNAAGPIFNLKNNFGWKDVTEQRVDVAVISDEPMTSEEWEASAGDPNPGHSTD